MTGKRKPIEWRKDIWPLLLFLLLPILSFPELIFQQRTLYRGDLTWIHYPLRILAAEQWRAGDIPLWNPYVLSGMPLLADAQIGVLQPLNALFLLPLPPYRILTLFVLLHFPLAAVATYGAARLLGIGRAGATLAGLSFGFGGFLMAQITNLNVMTGGVWLPLVFGAYLWALRRRRAAAALLGGLALALHILAAHPQIPFYTGLFLAGYALYESGRLLRRGEVAQAGRVWLLLALLVGNGALLAAPQIWPTWELQSLSLRLAGVDYGQMTAISLPPLHWLTLILPNLYGTTVTGYHGLVGNFEELNLYAGVLPLVLAFFSWRMRRRPEVGFFWLATILSLLLAAGGYTPLYRLLARLPLFSLFRNPTRWSMITNFALAMLAAYGLEAYLQRPRGWRWLAALWLGLTGLLAGVWLFREPLLAWVQAGPVETDLARAAREMLRRGLFETPREYGDRLLLDPLDWWVTPSVALVSRLGIGAALLIGYALGRLPRRIVVAGIIGLTAVDLALAGGAAVNRIKGADHWQQLAGGTRYIIEQSEESLHRFYTIATSDEDEVIAGLKHYAPSLRHLYGSGGHSPLMQMRYHSLMSEAHPLVRLGVTGTRFVLNKGRLTPDVEAVLPLVYTDGEWIVYEYPAALPRAFVMRQAVAVRSGEEALRFLRNGDFEPSQLLVLEVDEPLPPLQPEAEATDSVTISRYSPALVEIEAELFHSGFLVLLDNYYPGWHVFVDGQRQPIYRAYYTARALYLPAGRHEVRFVYRPLSFYGGVGLALIGWLLCGGAILYWRMTGSTAAAGTQPCSSSRTMRRH